jgi:hypothetical protein
MRGATLMLWRMCRAMACRGRPVNMELASWVGGYSVCLCADWRCWWHCEVFCV